MPIYEYECQTCGHVFDHLQKLSDPDPTQCERCHQGPIQRRVTAPSFRLAGSGWYETDFKKSGDKKRNLAGDSGGSGGSSGDSGAGSSSAGSSSTSSSSAGGSTGGSAASGGNSD
ncbi:transcriptional regulator [Ahniella affigens]|uniref:Transcriptional regulator n=1 Tax=Ahniella affigens TaxID=2021234 RepID=A0A2P1PV13_9GAMM|nr:zinc ribbon domain-containing protein [Ahniella affigens]AVP98695.1 transcriptional regulator [Ahniella affigens]